jgi:hypothetical protein
VVFARQFDSGNLGAPVAPPDPWEVPLLAIAGWLLYNVLSGRGFPRTRRPGRAIPTLAVFVFPLLLVAAAGAC